MPRSLKRFAAEWAIVLYGFGALGTNLAMDNLIQKHEKVIEKDFLDRGDEFGRIRSCEFHEIVTNQTERYGSLPEKFNPGYSVGKLFLYLKNIEHFHDFELKRHFADTCGCAPTRTAPEKTPKYTFSENA